MVKVVKLAGWLLGPALRLTRGRAGANPAQAQIRRQPRAVWGGKNLGWGVRIVQRPRLQSLHVILKLVVSGSSVTEAGQDHKKVSLQHRSDRMDSIPDIQLAASGRHSSKVCARCKKRKTKVHTRSPRDLHLPFPSVGPLPREV